MTTETAANVALSRRMRQTLDLLASGNSEKQVAGHLGICCRGRLGSDSTLELLAKARPQWRFRPHLGLDPLPLPASGRYNQT